MGLEDKLLMAKKFMEHDAMGANSGGNSRRVNIPQMREPNIPQQTTSSNFQNVNIPSSMVSESTNISSPPPQVTKEKILNSNLPDDIKKVMMENPIKQAQTQQGFSNDFINEVSKKMNDPKYSVNTMRSNSNVNVKTVQSNVNQTPDPIPSLVNESINKSDLKSLIKECLLEVLNEEELLVEKKDIKQNLQFRVGTKLFNGKITSIKDLRK